MFPDYQLIKIFGVLLSLSTTFSRQNFLLTFLHFFSFVQVPYFWSYLPRKYLHILIMKQTKKFTNLLLLDFFLPALFEKINQKHCVFKGAFPFHSGTRIINKDLRTEFIIYYWEWDSQLHSPFPFPSPFPGSLTKIYAGSSSALLCSADLLFI